MSDLAEMKARHEAALGRLAELGLALAADLQARALAAEEPEVAARLADSFHKVSRGVRQTLALEARLTHDVQTAAREAAAEEERARPLRLAQRQADVRKAVERMIWTEIERDEDAELFADILSDVIAEEAELDADFLDAPIEAVIQRFRGRIFEELAAYRADRAAEKAAEREAAAEPELRNSA